MRDSTYIIAEVGVNHNGDLNLAKELIVSAKECGVDCVKFQTFSAKRLTNKNSPKAKYQLEVTDSSESQQEMLKKLELSMSDFKVLKDYADKVGVEFMSTPYSYEDAIMLDSIGVRAFKISSAQLTEHELLRQIGGLGKQMILSTGMATLSEVFDSIEALKEVNEDIIVLQCTTNYPSKIEDANIRCMRSIGEACQVRVGYSDHVPNNYACYAAVALGAEVIEKHFTLDKSFSGPDHSSSLNPEEMKELVKGIRNIEKSLGSKVKKPSDAELKNLSGMRRGIKAAVTIKSGEVIRESMIEFKRPLIGLSPNDSEYLIGSTAITTIKENEPIRLGDIQWKSKN